MNLSLRTKLTLWSVGIVGVALLGLGTILYLLLSNSLLSVVDTSLLFYAKSLAANATNTNPNGIDPPTASPSESETDADAGAPLLSAQLIQFLDTSGHIIQQATEKSPAEFFGNVQPTALGSWQTAARLKEPYFETVPVPRGQVLRLVTLHVKSKDDEFFITVGQDLDDLRQLEYTIIVVLATSIPAVLLLLGLGGWFLVGRVLKPVDRLTRTAQHIGENNLRDRVDPGASGDELTRLAETFNQMLARLDAAFERQKQFTADAAHELRTPLAVMRAELELVLRRTDLSEADSQVFASLLEETLRLSTLVDDLLTLARSDSGELRIEMAPIDLTTLVREMWEYLSPLAESREVRFDCELPETALTVLGDQQRLRQLLLNVLDNALKYTPGKGQVTVKAQTGPAASVELLVIDNGPGVPTNDREKIFDRFYRHCHTGSNEKGGFGLGLSICRWIAQAHGGQLSVTETAGGGATFILTLPEMN